MARSTVACRSSATTRASSVLSRYSRSVLPRTMIGSPDQ